LVDLQDDFEEALPELQFRVDREKAAYLNLDTDTVGFFMRTAIYGLESSRFRADEDEFDITLRLPREQRDTLALMDQVFVAVPNGSVPLSSIGKVVYAAGRGTINRKDQKRMITVTGNTEDRGADKVLPDVQERLKDLELPPGYAIHFAGEMEDMQEAGAFLSRAFLIALALIMVILVIQFNSLILPLIIVTSVVLSLIGVMWGLLICGLKFGMIMTGVGVISLAGIVVNNAIVLVDCIQQQRATGLSALDAAVAAGKLRLRPVMLTAITTILGLIPMAIGYSLEVHGRLRIVAGAESSAWWAPMAVAVIFGLGVATVLTLVLVPVMYSLCDSLAAFGRRYLAPTE
jgi:multidrug efflux pump subunit AcrB